VTDATLEMLLRARLNDTRAMTAALNINADRVFLDFGQIGDLGRIRLRVRGNDIVVVTPELASDAPPEVEASPEAAAKPARAPRRARS
jgi:hypothetical protein